MTIMVFFILGINSVAMKLHWYSSLWYFDMLMHFLGGVFVALLGIYLLLPNVTQFSNKEIFKILLFVLIVGVGWEVFEILVDKNISQNPFNILDTSSDIFFDLSGGLLALLILKRRSLKV